MSESVIRLAHYSAGEWLAANGQEWTADINPSNATEVLARVPSADATAVNRAAEAAHSGFERWSTTSGPQRAEILHRAAGLLAQRRQDIATLIALEVGKPIGEALLDVDRGVVILRYIQGINCGMVRVNGDTTGVDPHAPFGGMRASSSHSREQGPAAFEFFTETKTVQINPAGGR